MAARVRIECIRKSDRTNPHERISAVGGQNQGGSRWRLSHEEAITGIKNGTYTFYVERPAGHVANVIVARSAQGYEYLKTANDGEQPNNLLALPECPV
jgi:hypothetical protein